MSILEPKRLVTLRRAARAATARTCGPFRTISVQSPGARDPNDKSNTIDMAPPTSSSSFASSSSHPFAESVDGLSDSGSSIHDAWPTDPMAPASAAAEPPISPSPPEEPDASTTAVARVALPQPWTTSASVRRTRHPFNSHQFVSSLEKSSVEPESAKALMEGVRDLIVQRTDKAIFKMLSREEMENDAYVFKAALSKLRTESNVRNRNTGLAARNAVSAVRRELESVERKMAGDMQVLKHDVELDMNNSKDDNRNDKKSIDLQIEEINSRATIGIGDLKTEIESAKWDSTRRAIIIIVVLVVSGVGISTLGWTDKPEPAAPPPKPKTEDTATRDIGIGTDDLFEDDYEERIDKILSAVPTPEPRPEKRKVRRPSKPDVLVDRI